MQVSNKDKKNNDNAFSSRINRIINGIDNEKNHLLKNSPDNLNTLRSLLKKKDVIGKLII